MKKKTLPILQKKKKIEKISMVTCYDATFARLVEKAGIDAVLVGDSLGMVIKGESHTLEVSIEEIIYHVKAVKRGIQSPFLIADMPFGAYQVSVEQGVENAVKCIKAGAEAVKVEGGKEVATLIERLTSIGIPVVGHVGLTPQYLHSFGGFSKRGKSDKERAFIKESAQILEAAGAGLLVLEMIPADLAKEITDACEIPTIGIGAGGETDGQVLVLYDLLGMNDDFYPGFVKQYLKLDNDISQALQQYDKEVKSDEFPQ